MKVGLDVGGRHAGTVVFDGELQVGVDDGEGDADLAGRGEGDGRRARRVRERMASAALRTRLTVMRSMISEGKLQGRREVGQVTRTVAAPAAMRSRTGASESRVTAWLGVAARASEVRSSGGGRAAAARRRSASLGRAGSGGCGGGDEQAADEVGAAIGDEAEFGGVVAVLGAENAGDVEEVAVETEGGEEIAGVVGEAGGFGDGGRWDEGGWRQCWQRLEGQVVGERRCECGEGIRAARVLCG